MTSESLTPPERWDGTLLDVRRPVTTLCVLACCGLWIAVAFAGRPDADESLRNVGFRNVAEIYEGAWWALFTSAFIHRELWHLAFNVYWLIILGGAVERTLGSAALATLVVVSACVSSAAELAASSSTGIGLSGAVYALFGFVWLAGRRLLEFEKIIERYRLVPLFCGWFFVCIALTYADILPVANAAHFAGGVCGAALGALVAARRTRTAFAVAIVTSVVAVGSTFWSPWSVTWLGVQAMRAYDADRHHDAIAYYDRLVRRDPTAAWAYFNRHVSRRKMGEALEAEADLARAVELAPTNDEWRKDLLYLRGSRAIDEKNYARAVELFTEYLELDPENANAYFSRSVANRELGHLPEAGNDRIRGAELEANRRPAD